MVNELRRRYFNKEMMVWLIASVTAQIFMLTYFITSMIRRSIGVPCVMDVFGCMSQNFVFPLLMVLSAICNQRMMKCDRDPLIILKYSSKEGIYFWQAVCTLIYSFAMACIYIIAGMVYAWFRLGVFFNWSDDGSYMAGCIGGAVGFIPFAYVIVAYWILMSLLLAITCFIGLIFEILFSSDILSGTVIILFAGVDIFKPLTYHKLLLFQRSWLDMDMCDQRLIISAMIVLVLAVIGYFLQRKREYYAYKKEDE